jgi:hypothetical protein
VCDLENLKNEEAMTRVGFAASQKGREVLFSKSCCFRKIILKNEVIAVFSKASNHAVTGREGKIQLDTIMKVTNQMQLYRLIYYS